MKLTSILLRVGVVALISTASLAADTQVPSWAFAVNPPGTPGAGTDNQPRRVPGSRRTFLPSEIAAIAIQPPDWHPEEHPPMPGIVGRSREPTVYACAYCHLPNGAGRPENASLAGLSAPYIRSQLEAFRSGNRPGSAPARLPQNYMIAIAQQLTNEEIEQSAAWFAALPRVSFIEVVESARVPATTVRAWTLARSPGGQTEPIGNRIIELANDFERFELRDSRTPYKAYVPPGSKARGKLLVTTGRGGRTLPCAPCHGETLHGMADVPPLAGRSPTYLYRQLFDLRNGMRKGATTESMKPVVANLSDTDLIDVAAYLSSLAP